MSVDLRSTAGDIEIVRISHLVTVSRPRYALAMQLLMDQARIVSTVEQLGREILRNVKDPAELALVGIRSRGEVLAQRLAAEIERQRAGVGRIDMGALDITMYRDDIATGRAITIPQGTEMNFRLDGRHVVLVDDVLQSGRSVRAALDALVDFGRPKVIRLAILVDRGPREFPIAADYIGMKVDAENPGQKIVVHLKPTDSEDAVYLA
jgi:pyrimidine operon attenuation protein/uracil phosphoribosyltransferase